MSILRIQNCYSWLITDDEEVKTKLWKALRFRTNDYFFDPRYRMRIWDGFENFFDKASGRFLTGLLPEVKTALKVWNVEYHIEDQRTKSAFAIESIDEKFLPGYKLFDYQVDYINQAIKLKRGLVSSKTGCHAKGQGILMLDGSIKKVEDIVVGDELMGPDSRKRTVTQLIRNRDVMYRINPIKGESFVVNGDHILTLISTSHVDSKFDTCPGGIVDVAVKDWLKWPKTQKHWFKLFRTGVELSETELSLDPYFLGVLLGDGSLTVVPGVTTVDKEILQECRNQATKHNLKLRLANSNGTRTSTWYFTTGKRGKGTTNFLTEILRNIGIWGHTAANKFIPQSYKTASTKQRMELLAGLIDTDGHVKRGCVDFISKSEILADDVVFLCRSLGFAAYKRKTWKKAQSGSGNYYYRVSISGDVNVIPCRIKRKKSQPRQQIKDVLRTGFTVEELNVDDYFGFSLLEEPHYLLSDFTVTHNSGKTLVMVGIIKALREGTKTLVLCNRTELVEQNYAAIIQAGIQDVGRIHGGAKEPDHNIICATWQSISHIKDKLPHFECIIVDEIHEMMSTKVKAIYRRLASAAIRIGLSATEFKYGGNDHIQKYDTKGFFGPPFLIKSAEGGKLTTKQLQEREILSFADCTIFKVRQPELPYEVYMDAVKKGIAENSYFHDVVSQLALMLKGRTIIMVQHIKHGDMLKERIPDAAWVSGKDNRKTRKYIIDRLKYDKGNVIAIATTGIFNTGINVFIHNLINAAGGKADHAILQRIGRGLRPADDKEILRYFDFYFTINPYLEKHSIKRIKILEKEGHKMNIKDDFDFNQVSI